MPMNTNEYQDVLDHVVTIVKQARANAVQKASAEMVRMYWLIGNQIVERSEWGNKFTSTRFIGDIRAAFPGVKGFSPRSLKYMAKFARARVRSQCAVAAARFP